ncbi:hypothetical protein J7E68_06535 [Microbacterium sp. ISL-103]|uniref:hypothetical protein n=1 Tax=Microbacterium sp. ISL-103 TaxID=2819156 RepID=UPI001BE6E76B|nr:hypothetical protein [Microbacterium sp. ISL-103]MBT2474243.1 hypothetical protein [Microbacterium sp. ISL-103]
MATITGLYTDVGLRPLNGRAPRLRFKLEGGPALSLIGGRVLSQAPVTVEPDARGYFSVDLIGNDQIQGKSTYRLIADYLGENGSLAESIDVMSGFVVTGVGGAITDMIAAFPPSPPFPTDQVLASHVATMEAGLTRVARNSDLAGSLTPDGRTDVVLLSGAPFTVLNLCTESADAGNIKAGVTPRKLTTTGAVTAWARYTATVNFPPASIFQCWVFIPEPAKVTSIGFILSTGWNRANAGPFQPGWNLLRFRAVDGTLTNWGTLPFVQLTFITTGATSISVGRAWLECPPKAQLCFIEDRGYKTFKDIGLPQLRALGIPVVWALDPLLNGTEVGTPSEVITDTDVAAFYAQGDDMSIHAYDGAVTSTMTAEQIIADSLKSIAWLRERGYSRGRPIRAAWTQNTAPNHAASQPYWAGYMTPTNQSGSLEVWPPIDKWNMQRYTLHGRTTAQIDAIFDQMKKTNSIMFGYTHGIHDTLSGAITVALWNYFISKVTTAISEGWLEGVTLTQLLARSSGIIR